MPISKFPSEGGHGPQISGFQDPAGGVRQFMIPSNRGEYVGFASTFKMPGIAGTAGQKLFSIYNGPATAKPVTVRVFGVTVGLYETVVKAVTVPAVVLRLWKVTVAPTNGSAVTKVAANSGSVAASSSVTVLQDASADGTSSSPTLTATLPAGTWVAQKIAPRAITAAGWLGLPDVQLLDNGATVELRSNEGLVVFADYVDAVSNPTTDRWTVSCSYEQYVEAAPLL